MTTSADWLYCPRVRGGADLDATGIRGDKRPDACYCLDVHIHDHQSKHALKVRMSRIVGHAESIQRMIEEDKDCSEVLIQIAAVRSALNNVGKILLSDHVDHCIRDAYDSNDPDKEILFTSLKDAIDKFVR
jgi:DNA-binding FrmR family transcriptional regulator